MLEPPEWVHVWYWLRFARSPQVVTPLPQQQTQDPDAMDDSHYELYHDEWLEVGAPRSPDPNIILALMGGRS